MDYKELVETYNALDNTSKRLEKTNIISKLIKKTGKEDIIEVIYLLQGIVFPIWDERKIGMGSKLAAKALVSVVGVSNDKVVGLWRKEGDLGKVAEILITNKKQRTLHRQKLTVKKVFENIRNLALLEGKGTVDKKIRLISELLSSADPKEARFITKTLLDKLRIGIREGIIRDALAWTVYDVDYDEKENKIHFKNGSREEYNKVVAKIQHAYNLTNDFGVVAASLKEKGLKGLEYVSVTLGKPINPMLAIKADDIKEALSSVGKPALFDYKLDGFRLQIHKFNNKYVFFTRRLENITNQFKELIPILNKYVKGKNYILDTEAVGYDPKTGNYLPFQKVSQRIKRKYDIEKIAKELPVEITVFDVIYYNNKNYMNEKQENRRKLIEKIVKEKDKKIVLTKKLISSDIKKIEKFYDDALRKGHEGLIAKNLNKEYVSGRRVGGWVKLKPVMEPLQLVIIGADWGEGKRTTWLSSFILGCKKGNEFLEIGKVGTGIKEKGDELTFKKLTKILKPLIESEKGRHVMIKPKILVEVSYEEIQRSPTYGSGYALRFPRLNGLRNDLRLDDCDDMARIERLYKKQKK